MHNVGCDEARESMVDTLDQVQGRRGFRCPSVDGYLELAFNGFDSRGTSWNVNLNAGSRVQSKASAMVGTRETL